MGYGNFSEETYTRSTVTRAATGRKDFEYTETATKIHPTLDPKRILTKPFGRLESRDSADHPMSTPVIMTFDVTGSNKANAIVAQKKLPELMAKLTAVCENPQIAIWANDDTAAVGHNAIQLGEFESDNKIDDTIRNVWLTGHGGGNDGESYDLLLYAAARKTITDSFEKRGKKGYMFLYADEPFFTKVRTRDVQEIFGDGSEADVSIDSIITEVSQKWNIFVIWPQNGYAHAREQYVNLFGSDRVETLQDPNMLCDKVASIISMHEQALQSNANAATADMTEDLHSRIS